MISYHQHPPSRPTLSSSPFPSRRPASAHAKKPHRQPTSYPFPPPLSSLPCHGAPLFAFTPPLLLRPLPPPKALHPYMPTTPQAAQPPPDHLFIPVFTHPVRVIDPLLYCSANDMHRKLFLIVVQLCFGRTIVRGNYHFFPIFAKYCRARISHVFL